LAKIKASSMAEEARKKLLDSLICQVKPAGIGTLRFLHRLPGFIGPDPPPLLIKEILLRIIAPENQRVNNFLRFF